MQTCFAVSRFAASSLAECLADETLFAFALGQLAPEAVASVERHLSECNECRSVVAETARALVAETPSRAADGLQRIGRYDLQGLLGAGAYGVVYRAFDPDLRRTVALKVLRPDEHSADEQRRERMVREAQAMAQLSHPNVVTVYDVGLHAGSVYIVMEHVAGGTARDFLTRGPRSTAEILDVYAKAGRGLSAAHEKGLVHRDFKPDNVLVGDDGRVRVTDFGLARIAAGEPLTAEGELASSLDLSVTKGVIGTPSYVAPEQFAGGAADERSDQFSFCVALFAALYGRHPFRAESGLSIEELSMRVRSGMVEEIPEAERIPQVHALLLRGLRPNPAERLPSMAALLTALDAALAPPKQGRKRLLVAALFALALLGLGWLGTRERAAPVPSTATPTPEPSSAPIAATVAPSLATAEPIPLASAAPDKAPRPKPRALPGKVSKPREQRYVDGLKEPF